MFANAYLLKIVSHRMEKLLYLIRIQVKVMQDNNVPGDTRGNLSKLTIHTDDVITMLTHKKHWKINVE